MSAEKIKRILQLINSDKSFENYFFNKLATSTEPLEWLIPLKDAGYFAPENNPTPEEVPHKKGYYTVPHWNILDALDNMAVKLAEAPDNELSKVLDEIVDGIINYRDKNGERRDNYRTDWKLLETISRFPIQYIKSKHIQFIKDALRPKIGSALLDSEIGKLFLPKLIKEEAVDLILELLNIVLHYSHSDSKYSDKYISVIDPYYLKEALDKNKEGIAKLCGTKAAKVAISTIQEILDEDESQFNYIWIAAIEDHEQTSFPDKYECQLVFFVRDMLEKSKSSDIEPIVQKLMHSKYDILRRLAYYLINHHYSELNQLLWNVSDNPLNDVNMHELFELFKNNCQDFSEEQFQTAITWIESKKYYFTDEIINDTEKLIHYEAYYKKEWLLALLESKHPDVLKKYEEYNEINDANIEHPGFHYWSETGWVAEVSPIEDDELLSKTNVGIADYINNYKEEPATRWNNFERVDLTSAVRKFVSNYPERFSKDLSP